MGKYDRDPIQDFFNKWQAEQRQTEADIIAPEYNPVNWAELARDQFELEWLVEGFWPLGSHMQLFAAPKTGKSLVTLQIAVSLAMGKDAFTGATIPAHDCTYLDHEMTRQNLQERLFDMGLLKAMESGALDKLHYHFYPNMGFLDTAEGGRKLMQWVEKDNSDVVVIDTLSRVVKGEENSNDTYKNFYNYTGALLKAHDTSLMRLDHEGTTKGKSRGASSKADDVDLVYQLTQVESGLQLKMTHSRLAYVQQVITLKKQAEPLTFQSADGKAWPSGTMDKAKELESIGAPDGISVRAMQRWLRERGYTPGRTEVLTAAIKYRNQWVDGSWVNNIETVQK